MLTSKSLPYIFAKTFGNPSTKTNFQPCPTNLPPKYPKHIPNTSHNLSKTAPKSEHIEVAFRAVVVPARNLSALRVFVDFRWFSFVFPKDLRAWCSEQMFLRQYLDCIPVHGVIVCAYKVLMVRCY